LHTFIEQKSWMKSGLKLLFHLFDILEPKVFTEGILDISVYHSTNQKILSTAENNYIFTICLGIHSHNMDNNKTVKFGVFKCY